MDANAQYELYLIKKELQDIINELNSIADGVRRDFCGIGNDRCANTVYTFRNHYQDVKKQLEKMDLSALSDEFLAQQQEEEARKAASNQAAAQKAAPPQNQAPKPQPSQKSSAPASSKQSAAKPNQNKSDTPKTTITKIVKEALSWLFK